MSKQDYTIAFGMGLLAGILGGITAGVLLAPKAGKETRAELGHFIDDFAQKHAPEIKNAKNQALRSMDLVRYKLEKQYKKINNSIKAKNMAKAKEKEFEYDDFNQ